MAEDLEKDPVCASWPAETMARYQKAGLWTGERLGEILQPSHLNNGARIAVIHGEKRISYAELNSRADALAAGLIALGVAPGDRVLVQLPNEPEILQVSIALYRIGAVPVYALPAHRSSEIGHLCRVTEAVAYVVPDQRLGFDYRGLGRWALSEIPSLRHVLVVGEGQEFATLEEVAIPGTSPVRDQPAAESLALLLLSGGSTGLPKLIPRTHNEYHYTLRASADVCALDQDTVYLAALPIAHNFALVAPGVLGVLHRGGTVVLPEDASPATSFSMIERHRVTMTALVPPLASMWLHEIRHSPADLSSLRLVQVGGAVLSADVAADIGPAFGCTLQQVYGMSEGLLCYTHLDDPDEVIVNGRARPLSAADEIRVVDESGAQVPAGGQGELLVRGPYTIRGYYRAADHNQKAFSADGFYRTGDLVRIWGDGRIEVTGRLKDVIHRGGEKVAPAEVEAHLLSHPQLRAAAVVSVPDDFLGERSCAWIVTRGELVSPADIRSFLLERGLAAYKLPDQIEFTDALPVTAVGKTDKRTLAELAQM